MDGRNIKVGDSFAKIMQNDFTILEVKEILHGSPVRTWKIVITKDDKFNLLKTSRELI
jgi:hypothetical protein